MTPAFPAPLIELYYMTILYFCIILVALLFVVCSFIILVIFLNIIFLLITKVPPVSTERKYFNIIFQQIKVTPQTIIYDLGCGDGQFLIEAAKFLPQKCIGYELSPIPYFLALFKAIFYGRGRVKIIFGNFFKADIRNADIVYVYLVPPLLSRVAQKLRQELRSGAVVFSKGSPLPGLNHVNRIALDEWRDYWLYIYKF